MPTKEKKTASELQELVLTEFRKHPELNNIQTVRVSAIVAPAPGGSTWQCHHASDGPAPTRITIANAVISRLQDQFDLL
jgi:hypothetical protein